MPTIRQAAWMAACCSLLAARVRGEEFPYSAYVAVDAAEVVAGPGHRYYATARLRLGTTVEVYREEASGWLAIRPPQGAFSWVPASAVERSMADRQSGRVRESTASWIGTAVEQVAEHRQQVTLKPGEVVEILGEKAVTREGGAEEAWLKIAPPAGEFRWIHLRDVSRQKPSASVAKQVDEGARGNDEVAGTPDSDDVEIPQVTKVAPPARPGNSIALKDLAPARPRSNSDAAIAPRRGTSVEPSASDASPDGFVPRKRSDQAVVSGTPAPAPAQRATITRLNPTRTPDPGTPVQPVATSRSSAGLDADEITRRLEQMEVDLSLMVAKEKSLWNLAPLRQRAEQLVEQGADPAGRGRARLLLDKIKQFEGAFDVADYGPVVQGANSSAPAGTKETAASGSLADPRYDAQGWLKPVISRKGDKPVAPFAVVDKDGKPLCFITPSPGLNLQSYLNKQVGVYGRRGYLEELKKPHLTAQRVIDLDRQWR